MTLRTVAVLTAVGFLAGGVLAWAQGENLTFGGVGLVISAQANDAGGQTIKVVGLTEDSPAVAAGVQVGDTITHIAGKAVAGMTLEEVVAALRGDPGTNVEMTIARPGQDAPMDVTVTRAGTAAGGLAAERAEGLQQVAQAPGQPGPGGPGRQGGQMRVFGARIFQNDTDNSPTEMASTDDYLFILRGQTLYQFKLGELTPAAQQTLITDEEKKMAEAGVDMGMMGTIPGSVQVAGGSLYVLRGYLLYQFSLADMKLVGQLDLRSDEEKERMAQQVDATIENWQQRLQRMQQGGGQQGGRGGRGNRGGGGGGADGGAAGGAAG